jgi:predicted O-methyltransferase YrrM
VIFTEQWFGPQSQRALAGLVAKVAELDGDIVEVGCWEGRSTIALADACFPARVHAVDTWQGSPGEISAELAQERDILATFLANTHGRNIDVFIMGWRDYFEKYRDPVRFLHIDGAHDYESVAGNIDAALPLMVPGSVMCGDDAHHPPVQQATAERFPTVHRTATLWWVTL